MIFEGVIIQTTSNYPFQTVVFLISRDVNIDMFLHMEI